MPPTGAKTFYDILGVAKDASQEELRKAWLALARKHHPDKTGGHKGSEEKLKIINEAYDTLKRPEKRHEYDEILAGAYKTGAPFGAGTSYGGSPPPRTEKAGDYGFNTDYSDLFDNLFGQKAQGRQKRGLRPGRDLETQVSISLKEAATGTHKSFSLPSMAPCGPCAGTGAAPGTKPEPCPQCGGAGHISRGSGSLFVISQVCPLCRGQGELIATPCPTCGGSGNTPEARTLSLAIPPGVRTGTRLRLVGQGEPGEPGAPQGDLYVVIMVEENVLFTRKRNDILCEVPITFTRAALGGVVEVPRLQGKARLTIPAGTQPGAVLRMRGLGFPGLNGGHKGDQLVTVSVEVPKSLSQEQQKIILNLHETIGPDTYPKLYAFKEQLTRWCE